MPRILFLCTGNTCRSPLAEVFARREFGAAGWVFDSAGLQVTGRQPASAGSVRVAGLHGLDLADHRSKPVSLDLLENTDWVIGMTRSHAAIFRSRLRGQHGARIGILGLPGVDLAGQGASPPCEEVDDPHGQSDSMYDAAGEQILRLVRGWGPVLGLSHDGTE